MESADGEPWYARYLCCCCTASGIRTSVPYDNAVYTGGILHKRAAEGRQNSDASSTDLPDNTHHQQHDPYAPDYMNSYQLNGLAGSASSGNNSFAGSGGGVATRPPVLDFRLYPPGRPLSVISEEGSLTDRTDRSVANSAIVSRRMTLEAPCSPPDPPGPLTATDFPDRTLQIPLHRRGDSGGSGGSNHSSGAVSPRSRAIDAALSAPRAGDTRSLAKSWGAPTAATSTPPPAPPQPVVSSSSATSPAYLSNGGGGGGGGEPSSSASPTTVWKRGESSSAPAAAVSTPPVRTGGGSADGRRGGGHPLTRQGTGYVGQKSTGEGGRTTVTVINVTQQRPAATQPLSLWGHMLSAFGSSHSDAPERFMPDESVVVSGGSVGGRGARGQAVNAFGGGDGGGGGSISFSSRAPTSLLSSRQPASGAGASETPR